MKTFVEYLALIMMTVVFYQFYAFSVSRKAKEKQDKCLFLGIFYLSVGTICLAFHDVPSVISGLVLIMLGLRLVAHGLDRVDKKIFIDHYADDDPEQ